MCSSGRQLIAITMLLFFLPLPAYSGVLSPETRQFLIENIRAHDVTILGERHRRSESTALLIELADALTADGNCLAVALEFDTDQNATLDAFMAGKEPVGAIVVSSIIDHPGFRDMLVELRQLAHGGRCLEVQAVDMPQRLWHEEKTRDSWIADQLVAISGERPVLALLGGAHALRITRWESGKDNPQTAELLLRQGLTVFSVIQYWPGLAEERKRTGSWYPSDHPVAHQCFKDLLRVRAVVVPDDMSVLADGVVVWE